MIKKISLRFALPIFMSYLLSTPAFAEDNPLSKKLIEFTEKKLVKIAAHPTIVQTVVDRNLQAISLQNTKEIDQIWISTPGINRFMMDLLRNDCAFELLDFENRYPFIVESFVMDNQGALVCMTQKTTDYWQGDEAKFKQSYQKGIGAIYYGELEHDSSVGEIVKQISISIEAEKQVVGAIVFTISLDRWERR